MERKKNYDFLEYLKDYYDEKQIRDIVSKLVTEKKLSYSVVEQLNDLGYSFDTNYSSDENSFDTNLSDLSELLVSKELNEELYSPIKQFKLSVRSYNCLIKANIHTLLELCELTRYELRHIRGLGQECYSEIINLLHSKGYSLKDESKKIQNLDLNSKYDEKEDIVIEDIDLSIRSYNCLKRAGINTVGQICQLTRVDLLNIRNLGIRSAKEIINKIQMLGFNIVETNSYDDDNDDDDECEDVKEELTEIDNDTNETIEDNNQLDNLDNTESDTSNNQIQDDDINSVDHEENESSNDILETNNDKDQKCLINMTLEELGINEKIINKLNTININDLFSLLNVTEEELYDIPTLSMKELLEIKNILIEKNHTLKNNKDENNDLVDLENNDEKCSDNQQEISKERLTEIFEEIFNETDNNDEINGMLDEPENQTISPTEADISHENQEDTDEEKVDDDFLNFYNSLRK